MSYHEPSYIRKDAMVAEALRNWEEYSREQAEINKQHLRKNSPTSLWGRLEEALADDRLDEDVA